MSSNPSAPPPNGDPDDDGFPQPGEGTDTIKYFVGTRFADGPLSGTAVPGHLIGELITRVSKLYSALRDGGANLTRAVENKPFAYSHTQYAASIDVFLTPAAEAEPALEDAQADDERAAGEDALVKLRQLVGTDPQSIAEVAAEHGGAVAMAYRQLTSLLGQRGVSASFFGTDQTEAPPVTSFIRLGVARASLHAEALSDRDVLRIETVRLVGVLDELASQRGVFKLLRPADLSNEQHRAWTNAVGSTRSLEGQLTDEAATDIRRLNAWSSRVEVELEVTHVTSPTTTRTADITADLVRIVTVQPQLGSD